MAKRWSDVRGRDAGVHAPGAACGGALTDVHLRTEKGWCAQAHLSGSRPLLLLFRLSLSRQLPFPFSLPFLLSVFVDAIPDHCWPIFGDHQVSFCCKELDAAPHHGDDDFNETTYQLNKSLGQSTQPFDDRMVCLVVAVVV